MPLDEIFFDISATQEEVARAPQPTAGTSTDLRLFRLRSFDDENAAAARLSAEKLPEGGVPLFYEPSLLLPVDDRPQTPFFFRFGDLQTTFDAQQAAGGPDAAKLNDPPKPRVITLAALAKALETGGAPADSVLVAASEAAIPNMAPWCRATRARRQVQ